MLPQLKSFTRKPQILLQTTKCVPTRASPALPYVATASTTEPQALVKAPRWIPSPSSRNHRHKTKGSEVISFPEEPAGIPADQGFGHLDIEIGDEIGHQGEYKIIRKLGYGRYSTVWLARPTRGARNSKERFFTAIKILTQYATQQLGKTSDEHRILQHISRPELSHKGKEYCTNLLDSFLIEGDNEDGPHQCLVLDVMAGDVDQLRTMHKDKIMILSMIKTLIGQMLVALQYLHEECRIVHTDIRPANLFITNPYNGLQVKTLLMKEKPEYYPTVNIESLGKTIRPIVSQPLLSPSRLLEFQVREYCWLFKLGDLDEAQFLDSRRTDYAPSGGSSNPEGVLGHPWDEKIDIYALGLLTFELLTGRPLLPDPSDTKDGDVALLASMIQSSGEPIPSDMLNDCDQEKVARYFGPDGPVEELLHKRSISPILEVLKECNREMSRDTKELETATAFIQRCIALRPSDRASATELLKDPWLSSEPIWGAHAFLDHNPKEDTGSTLIHVLTSWKLAEIACYSGTLAATAWFVWSIIS